MKTRPANAAFTLIELSIVLVIIGLIVGGVLVGQDLIRASEVRATITQVERYNTAANTFRGKYGALPGDLNAATAATFGFAARGTNRGQGDGNGIIEGYDPGSSAFSGVAAWGETTMFWVDLSSANGQNVNLIDGSFNTATSSTVPGGHIDGSAINSYIPQTKLGKGNYFYVYSAGTYAAVWNSTGINYFGLSAVNDIDPGSTYTSTPALSALQAYNIDSKMDDGYPQTGHVIVSYITGGVIQYIVQGTGATAGSPTTCFDNSSSSSGTPGIANAVQHYSLEISNGNGVNCALSFQFQ